MEPVSATQISCASSTTKLAATKRQQAIEKSPPPPQSPLPLPVAAAGAAIESISSSNTPISNEKQSVAQQLNSGEESGRISDRTCCKENQIKEKYERFCFACERSLAKSKHLINIAGQLHRWHPECFKCQVCNFPLDRESSCHIYKDKIVCKHDYAKLQRDNTIKCARCHWPIGALDWVRKAGEFVYHLACFTCDICSRQLSTGEQFTLNFQENSIVRLLCRLHFAIENQHDEDTISTDKLNQQQASRQQQQHSQQSSSPNRSSSTGSSSFQSFNHYDRNININKSYSHHQAPFAPNSASASYLHMLVASSGDEKQDHQVAPDYNELVGNSGTIVEGAQHQHQHHRHHHNHNNNHHHHHHNDHQQQQHRARTSTSTSSNGSATSANLIGLPSKSKRVRTTFTEDQLSILQTHFQIDSNPDGQDLERIATITHLSKRVTQVWFQNSRARQKKYLIKRKPSSASSSSAATASAAAASVTAALNNTIGLPPNSSSTSAAIQNSLFQQHQIQQQQQQQSMHSDNNNNELAKIECFNSHQYRDAAPLNQLTEQAKWSNISDQSNSDLSLDDATRAIEDDQVEGEETRSRSSDDQLEVSDYDSEQDH